MINNYPPCLSAVWKYDGIKDDEAPGEHFVTTWGITEATYDEAIKEGVIPAHPQALATPEDAQLILKAMVWDKTSCDLLPAGVDLMTFNIAMLSGNVPALKILQKAVGVTADGIIGKLTLSAINRAAPLNLIRLQYLYDLEYLRSLRNWWHFQHGWTNRENTMVGLARRMAMQSSTPVVV